MKFDFVDVFVRAAKITWKYKVLWIFGIFAGCSRSSSNSNSSSDFSGNGSQSPFSPEMERQIITFAETIGNWFENNPWVIYALIAFVLVMVVIQVFLSTVGISGLVRGVVQVESGAETLRFGELFTESLRYFWRVFGAGLLIWLPAMIFFFGLFILALLPLFSDNGSNEPAAAMGIFLFIFAFCCCLFPILIAVGLYNQMVNRAILAEELGFWESFKRGWQVLTKNILPILGVAVVIFIISLLAGLLIAIPILIPTFILLESFISGNIDSWQPFIILIAASLCYTPIFWLLNGILTTYTETVWTLSYLGFTRPEPNEPVIVEAPAPLPDSSPVNPL